MTVRRLSPTWIVLLSLAALSAAFEGGRRWTAAPSGIPGPDADMATDADAGQATWICPMHPEVRKAGFGACPLCKMDLVEEPTVSKGPGAVLEMSEAAVALAGIRTVPAERREATARVRLAGRVDYDETRVRTIAARVDGRVDRLFVDYTGIRVNRGDHLAEIYSPGLLVAQEELIEAKRRAGAGESSAFLAESSRRALESAREKLLLLGLEEEQVAEIERRESAEETVLINSPLEGVVVTKGVREGEYVATGAQLYQIADLSGVWVWLDAYESDLEWLRYGQDVTVEADAIPGVTYDGWISFLGTEVDERTRTIPVRVEVDNADGALKPGMFARGVVQASLGAGGRVADPDFSGLWLCPMHPEVVSANAVPCMKCGMRLVWAEDLGLVKPAARGPLPLMVPATAVLRTGARAVVYVAVPGGPEPSFEGRRIVLGPRAGGDYVVLDGLKEGERVVVNGAFKIDSALQIQARPSMMNPEQGR